MDNESSLSVHPNLLPLSIYTGVKIKTLAILGECIINHRIDENRCFQCVWFLFINLIQLLNIVMSQDYSWTITIGTNQTKVFCLSYYLWNWGFYDD